MLTGIDFSYGGGITTAQIKAAGYQFVGRYLSGGSPKDISALEVANYRAAGLPVIFVWEVSGNEWTEAAGTADARTAVAELTRVGAPGATVFFAQDVPVAAGTNPVAYMTGVCSVIGLGRAGGYGQYSVVRSLFDAGVVRYGWQTSGGSAGKWDDRALLRQVGYQVHVGPAEVDTDQAAFWASAKILGPGDDFGQYPRPASPAPPPVTGAWNYAPPVLRIVAAGRTSVKFTAAGPAAPVRRDHYQVYIYSGKTCSAATLVPGYPRNVSDSQADPAGTWQTGGLARHRDYTLHVAAAGPGETHVKPGVYASAAFTTG